MEEAMTKQEALQAFVCMSCGTNLQEKNQFFVVGYGFLCPGCFRQKQNKFLMEVREYCKHKGQWTLMKYQGPRDFKHVPPFMQSSLNVEAKNG